MGLKRITQQVSKGIHTLAWLNKLIAVVVFCMMGVLTTADVIGRYVFHASIIGTYEIVQVLLMVLVYCIFAFVAEVDFNVRVDVLFVKLSKRVQAIFDIFSSLASILMISLITWQLAVRTWQATQLTPMQEWVSSVIPWPFWPFAAVSTFGCAVLILELLLWFFRSIKAATT